MKFGTPGYMAPEIFHYPEKISEKVDIYACGATLYYMYIYILYIIFRLTG